MPLSTLQIALLIFALPLAAFGVMAVSHKRIARHGDWLATAVLGLCLILALAVFRRALRSDSAVLVNWVFAWLPLRRGVSLSGGLLVDRLTALMLVVVTLVSFLVHLFSVKYMAGDVRYGRYFCGLLLFSASMLGLVLANNLLYLFVFWELVGLSSYLLIGHWYEKKTASDAAIKAFITTRVGDVGMFIGLMVCWHRTGSVQYADLFAAVENGALSGDWRTIAGIGLFLGAMGKSAQFPLHVWLPDAMEGPTPVSALIHAATMVAAGVYLVGRLLPLFDETTLLTIAYVGAFTAIFAATIALVQDDIKKVLAYSTVSQLGYMMLALGVGGYVSGLFHLTTHAFFKAGLFLGSGAVIYAMHHEQSLKKYGGLWRKLPVTAACCLLCTLALVGFPGFSGFFSKDAILADALAFSTMHGHWFLPAAGFITVFLTAFYMFRQYFLTFTGRPRDQHAYAHAREVPWQMLAPLLVLGALSVGSGWGGWFERMNPKRDASEQIAAFAMKDSRSADLEEGRLPPLRPAEEKGEPEAAHGAHAAAMKLSTSLALLGILCGALMYCEGRRGRSVLDPAALARALSSLHKLLLHKYYLDELYRAAVVMPVRRGAALTAAFDRLAIDGAVNAAGAAGRLAGVFIEAADRRVVDDIAVLGTARAAALAGEKLSWLQSGYLRRYIRLSAGAMALIGIVAALAASIRPDFQPFGLLERLVAHWWG